MKTIGTQARPLIGREPAPEPEVVEPQHRFTRRGRDVDLRIVEVNQDPTIGHALIFGNPKDGCLVRIHSRCLYGDALASEDCDCGPELNRALNQIQDEGHGILIYLEQEGRGAGLINKARGYRLSQQCGIDTFASYERLHLPLDTRTYVHAARTLRDLGLVRIRLLTNNPGKVRELRQAGLLVDEVQLAVDPGNHTARAYLAAKRLRSGHRVPRWWWLHRWSSRLRIAAALMAIGLISAVLAIMLRPAAITLWERAIPSALAPNGGFAASAVGLASVVGVVAGRYFSPRRRLLLARARVLVGRNRL